MTGTLAIPALSLVASVATGHLWFENWNPERNLLHQSEATQIMEQHVYKYPQHNVLAAHDYKQFSGLKGIKYNALVIHNQTRYRVRESFLVNPKRTDVIIYGSGITLITCEGDMRRIIRAVRP